METFYLILSLIAVVCITKFIIRKNEKLPPSPFPSVPIVGHLYLLKSPLYRALAKVSNRHGPMLMLQFGTHRTFLVSSPAAGEECLTTNDATFANRPQLLAGKHIGYDYTTFTWSNHNGHWRNLRRIASLELLSAQRLHALSPIRMEEARLLVNEVHLRAMRDGMVEMKSLLFEMMLNVVVMMIAGKRFFGDLVGDVEEARRFKGIVKDTFEVMESANVSDYLPLWKWVGGTELEKKMVALRAKRDGFMQDLLDDYKRRPIMENEEKTNLIEGLVKLQEADPECYKDDVIKGLMLELLSAGSDATSGTMEWMLSLMLNC